MTRFDITRILAPQAIKPRTSGPRDGLTEQHINPPTTEPTMSSAPGTQPRVLAAITKQSPINLAELATATGLTKNQLSNAIYNLKKIGKVTGYRDQYQLATEVEKPAPANPKAAKPKVTKANGHATFTQRLAELGEPAPENRALHSLVAASARRADARAIATKDGGAIVLDGALLVAELTAEQVAAIRAL